MSLAACQRRSGSLARHFRTSRSRPGGVSGWSPLMGSGSRSRMAAITLACDSPANGRRPVAISYTIAAEGEDVRPGVDGAPFELLGRHVRNGADEHALAGQRQIRQGVGGIHASVPGRLQFGQAEVQHLHAAARQHDVARLEIPVDDAGAMRGRQGVGQLRRNADGLVERQRRSRRRPAAGVTSRRRSGRPGCGSRASVRARRRARFLPRQAFGTAFPLPGIP